ncbi:hypothetical protein WICPIJ_007891 [Wickerhamomyces pijperi]|uniref:Major facilitator superfamily (MFS) profile domain-containing protein n=1 Tax=Wickerhamomyces pijperi TaxID=599730 RepID=A0A9P8Q0T8_WICPI|nr:hypothetical protein WICPIJ_007891 [Wickerhamomyces pijperi]
MSSELEQADTKPTGDIESESQSYESQDHVILTADQKIAETKKLAEQYGINEKAFMRKVDLWVVPPMILLYFLAFIDRINVGNAKAFGMEKAIGLHGHQYNTALAVFFVPYIFFEVISNKALKIVKPHIWLSSLILLFGAVTIGMGFVKNYGQLVACRFLLGIFEAGTFPGIFYVLSTYYSPIEAQKRFSFFFSSTCLAGAAGGSIAYRIHDLNGKHGIDSWAWIFIIEGSFTAGLALLLFFCIPDFPETSRFLNENEREFLKKKLQIHTVDSGFDYEYTFSDMWTQFKKDPTFIYTSLAYFGLIIPAYGYAYFAPTIVQQSGYTNAQSAQAHSVYPWLLAFGATNIVAYFSDLTRIRSPYALGSGLVGLVGLAMVLGSHDPSVRYGGCFLTAGGLYSCMPQLICWNSLNFNGHVRKALGTSFQIGFGNIGGIIAVFIFLSKDSPRFVTGLSVCLAFTVFALVMICVIAFHCKRMNDKKATVAYRQKFFAREEKEIAFDGDLNPNFEYLY